MEYLGITYEASQCGGWGKVSTRQQPELSDTDSRADPVVRCSFCWRH